jgi:hypothetical protein
MVRADTHPGSGWEWDREKIYALLLDQSKSRLIEAEENIEKSLHTVRELIDKSKHKERE